LKPDVCRRVVGRLPSPHIQDSRLGLDLVSTARDGATIHHSHSFLRRGKNRKSTVVYLVRSYRTYARMRSLTTGTFNLLSKTESRSA
jgi:hypothetical protein